MAIYSTQGVAARVSMQQCIVGNVLLQGLMQGLQHVTGCCIGCC
jgi:hypothetical protein